MQALFSLLVDYASISLMNPIELNIFFSRIAAVCDEMGVQLRRAAFSPNIKDRLDFSCAIFDARGELCAQAAHIPVHLGSMAYAMKEVVVKVSWSAQDMLILNDPFLGGTHLPDITLIAPVFNAGQLLGFVVNRAHHADIGAGTPGSMPISSSLYEEGVVIPPTHLIRAGVLDESFLTTLVSQTSKENHARADFSAQISANLAGVERLQELLSMMGSERYLKGIKMLNNYAEILAQNAIAEIPNGCYEFTDILDDDGFGQTEINISVCITVRDNVLLVDFAGTHDQVGGNINCPLSVAVAAVFYVFRCLMPPQTPACAGVFRPLKVQAPKGCLLNALRPAAVAAGNVETSTRVVDVVIGALAKAVPLSVAAASQGSMNNVAMGATEGQASWDYYETIGGGCGASAISDGLSAVQSHMTNTLNTPIESLEMHYPLRITQYQLREHSGGVGMYSGGCGLIREFEFLQPSNVTLLTERRTHAPWGLSEGGAGKCGRNTLDGKLLPGKTYLQAQIGQRLKIETPGGGGWGRLD